MVDCVLVTGGSRNIGRGICERLTEDGHTVVQFDVLEPENPGAAIFVKVDLSNEKATADALTTLSQQHRVTRLVNNVGISSVANVEDVSLDEFDRVIRINTRCCMSAAACLLGAPADSILPKQAVVILRAGAVTPSVIGDRCR